jgi:phage shock protein PspC (stress-responsive transcriptional regulator)
MIGILTGPILYFIWRRMYGGLSKKDPEAFVCNPRTGLAVGDTRRISFLLLIVTLMNIVALIFEPWYEGWGTEDAWESGDYFDGIMEAVNVDTIVGTIRVVLWVVTIVCAAACIIIYLISKKVEPSKEDIKAAFKKSCDAISARHNKELEEMIAEEEIAVAADAVERAAAAAEEEVKK